jgi:predicted dehydrogenase
MKTFTRRDFLSTTTKGAAAASLLSASLLEAIACTNRMGPNEKVRAALIGCNGVGWDDLTAALKTPGIEFVSLCDVDQNVLLKRSAELEKATGKKTRNVGDYRKVLDMKDVDAIFVATPDHWHALPMIHGCQAGKDVYIEKPMGRTIEECLVMVQAQKKYKTVVQVGQQQRSAIHWKNAIDFAQSGKLGHIRQVKAWSYVDWKGAVPIVPDEPVPAGVDYDMWLGPAPKRPFNKNRFHKSFRWYWDYAGGLMSDWGVHMLDMVLWGMNAGGPNAVISAGGKYAFPDDAMQTPDLMNSAYEFDKFMMTWEHTIGIGLGPYGRTHGVAFIGDTGTLVVDRNGWEVIAERFASDRTKLKMEPLAHQKAETDGRVEHTANFVKCIRSREKPICDVSIGANVAINAHLGNIAYRLGRKVYWDKNTNTFINDPQANELIKPQYRLPWELPKL